MMTILSNLVFISAGWKQSHMSDTNGKLAEKVHCQKLSDATITEAVDHFLNAISKYSDH